MAISKKEFLISIEQCDEYDFQKISHKIKNGIDKLGGINQFIKKGEKVLLKPNLLRNAQPQKAVTTHPEFLRAVIRIVKDAGAIPYVGDSPALISFKTVISGTGIKKVCEEEKVTLVNLDNPVKKENPDAKVLRFMELSEKIFKFDKIINLPKLKNHILTKITCGVKNLYGAVPGIIKGKLHYRFQDIMDFSNMLLDVAYTVNPVLTIVDGIIAMEGNGPGGGEPKKTGIIIIGNDVVAVDLIAAKIMNYEPFSIPTNLLARNRKLGGYDFEHIKIFSRFNLEELIIKDFKKVSGKKSSTILPKMFNFFVNTFVIKKPFVDKSKCVGCGDCTKVCPADAIKIKNKFAIINYKKCIKCYCCVEICPVKAIKLKLF